MVVYLTGMSGVGKSTVSKKVEWYTGFKSFDTDEYIELSHNMSIKDIFLNFGESRFREMELEALVELSDISDVIIATGGGAVINDHCYNFMKSHGTIICLMRSPESIWSTIEDSNRPLLIGKGYSAFIELYNTRLPLYKARCDILLEGDFHSICKQISDYCFSNRSV